MNVGGKLTLVVSVDKEGLEKYTSSEIYIYTYSNFSYRSPLESENISLNCSGVLSKSLIVNDSIKVCMTDFESNDSVILIFSSSLCTLSFSSIIF